jgi:hypothetical protein
MLAPFFISGILINLKNDPMSPPSPVTLFLRVSKVLVSDGAIPRDVGDYSGNLPLNNSSNPAAGQRTPT